ncbi:unnamed protein product [Bursaphelenchus xylophilus]|uniref:(pine wood nematode) hypothetical protein n=1 Tax=Bursaphelenchus xylophilus TaxID=6326 RepID=A0A1I7S7H0_BURXY|nr:unnamed protein product [Bursaphelenchus xylophilus]CAG9085084.1 unnamed protein product [Bursaphelenchus xylophilus]
MSSAASFAPLIVPHSECKNTLPKKVPTKKSGLQFVKMALPHVGLYSLIFGYLMLGAWAFKMFEFDAEREHMREKLKKIETVYSTIDKTMNKMCIEIDSARLYNSLSRLSSYMEGKPFKLNPHKIADVDDVLPSKWDTLSSILYALSILTTTGYGYVNPTTVVGKIFSMGYGFIGIPLMFLAAVDIGRFLSHVVLKVYNQFQTNLRFTWCCPKKNDVISQVETKARKVLTPIKRKSFSRKSFRKKNSKKDERSNKKRLPLSVNASILLLFCMFGGLVYIAAGGNQKTFFGAFFVTFNLVANLTMAEMPTDISKALTVLYITIFVTFGLAVLSMCAELAAGELKWIFLKIHYFGRKINWKRKQKDPKEEQIDIEVTELLNIINQIKSKYPEKREITSVDLLKYVQELNGGTQSITFNMFMKQHRRDTIAFMPQSIEALKFADEMDFDDQSGKEELETEETDNLTLRFST